MTDAQRRASRKEEDQQIGVEVTLWSAVCVNRGLVPLKVSCDGTSIVQTASVVRSRRLRTRKHSQDPEGAYATGRSEVLDTLEWPVIADARIDTDAVIEAASGADIAGPKGNKGGAVHYIDVLELGCVRSDVVRSTLTTSHWVAAAVLDPVVLSGGDEGDCQSVEDECDTDLHRLGEMSVQFWRVFGGAS